MFVQCPFVIVLQSCLFEAADIAGVDGFMFVMEQEFFGLRAEVFVVDGRFIEVHAKLAVIGC